MKQFDLFKTEEELFIEESENFILELEKQITELEEQEKFIKENNGFDWAKEFPKLCDSKSNWEGFDLVIGNPPFLNFKKYSKGERSFFKTEYAEIYNGKSDIYYFFFYQGLRILKNNGILSFITSRYWLEAEFAEKLRKFISSNFQLNEIIDFKNVTIFEGVGIKTSIAQITKKISNDDFILNYRYIDSKKIKSVSINDFVSIPIKYNGIKNKAKWTLSVESELSILKKIETDTIKLEEIADCKQGIVTGLDKAFITTTNEFENLPKELVKTFIKVGDIHKYCIIPVEKRELIYTNDIKKISDYPELEKRLTQYKTQLSERREAQNGKIRWFDLQWSRNKELFESPKLICRFKAAFNTFMYDENNLYSSADTTIVRINKEKSKDYDLKYLLGLLNSKLLDYYLKSYSKLMDYRYEYGSVTVGRLRIKKSKNQKEIIKLVDKILEIKSNNPAQYISEIEKEIDNKVYEIYGIDETEIQIIEGKLK